MFIITNWLVVWTSLKNMSSSVGTIIISYYFQLFMESHNPFHGSSHHQPVIILGYGSWLWGRSGSPIRPELAGKSSISFHDVRKTPLIYIGDCLVMELMTSEKRWKYIMYIYIYLYRYIHIHMKGMFWWGRWPFIYIYMYVSYIYIYIIYIYIHVWKWWPLAPNSQIGFPRSSSLF